MKRTCAYCGKPDCRCQYRYKRMGNTAVQVENVSEQSTAGEMQEEFLKVFSKMRKEVSGAWCISFTAFDNQKLAKRRAKAKP